MNTSLNQNLDDSRKSNESEPPVVDKHGHNHDGHPPHNQHDKVRITVDGVAKDLKKGEYSLAEFREAAGIASDLEVDKVVDGVFVPLDDNAEVHIKGGEVFISHVRQGGSA